MTKQELTVCAQALLAPAVEAAKVNAEVMSTLALEIVDRVQRGGSLFAFGAGHAYAFAAELCSRAGGQPQWTSMNLDDLRTQVRPAHMQLRDSNPEREPTNGPALALFHGLTGKDVLVIASHSGRNASQIEMARWAREQGIFVIAVVSRHHCSAYASRHPSGLKLVDVADAVLDLCTPVGDAVLKDGQGRGICAASTISFALLAQMLNVCVVSEMETRGIDTQIIVSANVDGASP